MGLVAHARLTPPRVERVASADDPRLALRERDDMSDDEMAEVVGRLARLDRSSRHGEWTTETLQLIAEHPGVRAGDLATQVGREMQPFKTDVRKLKGLGLTESLEVGYRLSPRGEAVLTFDLPSWGGALNGPAARLGLPDAIFLAVFTTWTLRLGLRLRLTIAAMTCGLLATMAISITADRTIPALPLLAVGFLLPNVDRLVALVRAQNAQSPRGA